MAWWIDLRPSSGGEGGQVWAIILLAPLVEKALTGRTLRDPGADPVQALIEDLPAIHRDRAADPARAREAGAEDKGAKLS